MNLPTQPKLCVYVEEQKERILLKLMDIHNGAMTRTRQIVRFDERIQETQNTCAAKTNMQDQTETRPRHDEHITHARDDPSIKQTEIKNIAMAQWLMGQGKNNDEHKYFVGQFSGFMR